MYRLAKKPDGGRWSGRSYAQRITKGGCRVLLKELANKTRMKLRAIFVTASPGREKSVICEAEYS
jgi:hypothetical protein